MVLGESQILGQVRDAMSAATAVGDDERRPIEVVPLGDQRRETGSDGDAHWAACSIDRVGRGCAGAARAWASFQRRLCW